MAGEWIKMRVNLWDDPRVCAICDSTGVGEAAVIGSLYWLWSTADQHTEDGVMQGMSFRQIDRKVGVSGFAEAVARVGWLEELPDGIRIIRFEEHNGASAKRRASESRRKMSARDADKLRTQGGTVEDETGKCSGGAAHLEEEEEEEVKQEQKPPHTPPAPPKRKAAAKKPLPAVGAEVYSPGFEDFWDAYPNGKRSKKAEAWGVWQRDLMEDFAATIVKDVVKRKAMHWGWVKENGKYIPGAQVYLNGRRWNDDIEPIPARPVGGRRDAVEQANAERAREWAGRGASG